MPILILMLLIAAGAQAADPAAAAAAARSWRQAHEGVILREYVELLSIPNIASDLPNIRRNAALITQMLEKRGMKTRLLETPGVPPVVYGELPAPGARETIVFYAHYDGQPVEPKEWVGGDPFHPVLRSAAGDVPLDSARYDPEWRLYARSTGDDKAPIIALTSALDALRAARITLPFNVKFFFEGEEEAGSTHLETIVRAHQQLLSADLWIFCDGPVHQNRQQQIVFGARGVTGLNLTVYGPRRELHSGHYGNWGPNPAMMLAQLLATMKSDDGRVLIEDFYKGVEPLTETEKRALAAAPDFDAALRLELWLDRTEGGGKRLDDLIQLPSLNIRGLRSASVGAQSRNVIPAEATASIDIRLVKGVDHRAEVARLIAHIRAHGYFVTESEPDEKTRMSHEKIARVTVEHGYNAVRTPMDLPMAQRLIRAVEQARGPVVKMPTSGGSLPLTVFDEVLKTPVIVVPIANHDNNQHGHNENMRLQNLWDGIETMAALLTM